MNCMLSFHHELSTSSQILDLYKEYIDPEFTYENFTLEEQAKVIKAPRSNNLLDTTRVSTDGHCSSTVKYWETDSAGPI